MTSKGDELNREQPPLHSRLPEWKLSPHRGQKKPERGGRSCVMRVDGETEERTMGCWSEGKEGRKVSGGH